MNNVVALIPARGGSKGVPFKNIKTLGGYPLLAYTIAAAKCSKIGRVILSTDSEKIASVGMKYGAEVPFIRPEKLAKDNSPDRDFVLHALQWFVENEDAAPDYLVHLRPTTPLRDPDLIDEAIDLLIRANQATSLRSAHEASESPFKWFMLNQKNYFEGFSAKDTGVSHSNLPRQMFPKVYIPDGYVDILRTSFVLNANDIHGEQILGYISPPCSEVDTLDDFEYLEFQLEKKGSPILDFLKQNYPL